MNRLVNEKRLYERSVRSPQERSEDKYIKAFAKNASLFRPFW